MLIYITGLSSVYEPEHLTRIFFADAAVSAVRPPRGADMVRAAWGKKSLMVGVRLNGKCTVRRFALPADAAQKPDFVLDSQLFLLLREVTGVTPPWGLLTGVRPVRLVHDMAREGKTDTQIAQVFRQRFYTGEDKIQKILQIAQNQRPILQADPPRAYSLYVSIPFCPSRCSYCSFVSRTTEQSKDIMAPYVQKLCLELADIRRIADRNGLQLQTVYVGGGTPTALSAQLLQQLLECICATFDMPAVKEFTVEAGRPDCTTAEKLRLMKRYGVTRISINPQTLSDEVLQAIGRRHTAQDIIQCYHTAREEGHDNINMDLIAGLPRDTVAGFAKSLEGVMRLAPENITVHTLTLKRASNIVIDSAADEYDDAAAMLEHCGMLEQNGWQPYYLYRQKKTLQNLENTGYTRPGKAGLYNIFIMEEVHTILAAGAGASTKLVKQGEKIERIYNHKYPLEYIQRFDTVLERKQGVDAFYARYMDSQAAGGNQPGQHGGAQRAKFCNAL